MFTNNNTKAQLHVSALPLSLQHYPY